jgi:hypothetical protein
MSKSHTTTCATHWLDQRLRIIADGPVEFTRSARESYRAALDSFAKHKVKFVYGSDLVSPWGEEMLATEAKLQLAEFAIYVQHVDNLSTLKSATSWGGG